MKSLIPLTFSGVAFSVYATLTLECCSYEEYPKMKELVNMKAKMVADSATPPFYLKVRFYGYWRCV